MPPHSAPKWRHIADELAQLIVDGVYVPGDRLPPIQELVRAGRGSTATVHRAYKALATHGLVRASRGHGTTVLASEKASHVRTAHLGQRSDRIDVSKRSSINRRAILGPCEDEQVADALGIKPADEIVIRSRIVVRDDEPVILTLNFIHTRALAVLPELLDAGSTPAWRHDLYRERTEKQIRIGPERLSARLALDNELAEFGIEVLQGMQFPVLVERTLFSDEDGPLELWEDVYRPGSEKEIWSGRR